MLASVSSEPLLARSHTPISVARPWCSAVRARTGIRCDTTATVCSSRETCASDTAPCPGPCSPPGLLVAVCAGESAGGATREGRSAAWATVLATASAMAAACMRESSPLAAPSSSAPPCSASGKHSVRALTVSGRPSAEIGTAETERAPLSAFGPQRTEAVPVSLSTTATTPQRPNMPSTPRFSAGVATTCTTIPARTSSTRSTLPACRSPPPPAALLRSAKKLCSTTVSSTAGSAPSTPTAGEAGASSGCSRSSGWLSRYCAEESSSQVAAACASSPLSCSATVHSRCPYPSAIRSSAIASRCASRARASSCLLASPGDAGSGSAAGSLSWARASSPQLRQWAMRSRTAHSTCSRWTPRASSHTACSLAALSRSGSSPLLKHASAASRAPASAHTARATMHRTCTSSGSWLLACCARTSAASSRCTARKTARIAGSSLGLGQYLTPSVTRTVEMCTRWTTSLPSTCVRTPSIEQSLSNATTSPSSSSCSASASSVTRATFAPTLKPSTKPPKTASAATSLSSWAWIASRLVAAPRASRTTASTLRAQEGAARRLRSKYTHWTPMDQWTGGWRASWAAERQSARPAISRMRARIASCGYRTSAGSTTAYRLSSLACSAADPFSSSSKSGSCFAGSSR
mmetsp:Transcript_24819/g.59038  ORF Transcript_24819/g.59038 Transcript_24819/m.59038 type:complete len:637 (-) Transcript_24819:956-2866(-)